MSGSHTLEKFINKVARDIQDPEKNISVWKRSQLARIGSSANLGRRRGGTSPEERNEARQRPDLRIGALGSGSDYTPFLQHLGIASLNLGYGGEDGGGIYHSIYDDFYWYTHFSDTDFAYGRTLAQTVGTAVMRLADAELLPYDFTDFADTLKKYVGELQTLLKNKQEEVRERNKEIEEGDFSAPEGGRRPAFHQFCSAGKRAGLSHPSLRTLPKGLGEGSRRWRCGPSARVTEGGEPKTNSERTRIDHPRRAAAKALVHP